MQISENPNQLMASASDCMWWDQPHLGSPLRQTLLDVPGCQCGRRPAWWTRCSGRRSRPTNTSLWKQWSQFKTVNKHQDIFRVTACILVFFMDHFYILILVQTAAAWVLRSTFSPKAPFQFFSCFMFECKTHPLSDALTMYCLSLHALALARQVMEAVWPNNMARGQIWTEDKRREFFFFFTILRRKTWQKYEKKLTHLQLGRHVPQADLAVVAAGDDGAEVVHHQQAADAVCGSCAAP